MKFLRAAIPLLIICALAIGFTSVRGAAFTPAYLSVTAFGGLLSMNWAASIRSVFCTRCGVLSSSGGSGGADGATGWKRDSSGDIRPCGGNSIYGGC